MLIVMECSFRPSEHAKVKMIMTGMSKNKIMEAILKGPKRVYDNKIIATYQSFEVAYKKYPCNFFIITVYWKR